MNINLDNTQVVQVATGYDKALNYYIFAVTWDGANYSLRRFNTLNLLSPYQDAFSVNLPSVAQMDNVLSITVLTDKVMVLVDANTAIALFYDFDLNYLSQIAAPNFAFDSAAFQRNLTFDGQYFVHSLPGTTRIRTRQLSRDSWQTMASEGTPNYTFQVFTPDATAGPIRRVGVYIKNPNSGIAKITFRVFRDNVAIDTSSEMSMAAGFEGWIYFDTNVAVNVAGQYALSVRGAASGSGFFTPDWGYQNSNVYSGGFFVANKFGLPGGDTATGTDAKFVVYQEVRAAWKDKVVRFQTSDYSVVDTFAYPATTPDELMAFDAKFYLGFNSAAKQIVKFGIANGSLAEASTQNIEEDLVGQLAFNNYIYFVYKLGTALVAVPVSI
jgi:hypothetical protein